MKHGNVVVLVALVASVTCVAGDLTLIEELNTMHTKLRDLVALQDTQGTLQENLECSPGDLQCTGNELDELIGGLTGQIAVLEAPMQEADDLFSSMTSVHQQVNRADTLQKSLSTALMVLKALPVIGSAVFTVPHNMVKTLRTPIDKLDAAVDDIQQRVVEPWDAAVGDIMGAVMSVNRILDGIGPSIANMGEMFNTMCLRQTLHTLVPATKPAYEAVSGSLRALVSTLRTIVDGVKKLVAATSSSAWNAIKKAFNGVANAMKIFTPALDALKPLTDLLEREVSIKWIGTINGKDVTNLNTCSTSYPDRQMDRCWESCRDGYYGVLGVCWARCPKDWTDTGLGCKNPNILHRKQYARVLKSWKLQCPTGTYPVGLVCYEPCPEGYEFVDRIFFAECIKPCPENFVQTIEKSGCDKKTHSRKSEPLGCPSGWTKSLASTCWKNCPDGDIDIGAYCTRERYITISIKSIMDRLSGIIDKIRDFPIFKIIENAIDSAVRVAMGALLNVLNVDLPQLPSLDISIVNLNALPVVDLVNQLRSDITSLVAIDDHIQQLFSIPDHIEGQVKKIASSINIGPEWMTCTTLECLTQAVNLPVDLAEAISAFQAAKVKIAEPLSHLADAVKGCKTEQSVNVPVSQAFASIANMDSSAIDSCDFALTVCTELDLDQQIIDNITAHITEQLQPTMNLVDQAYKAAYAALHQEHGRRLGASSVEGVSYSWPLFYLPVTPIIPAFKFGRAGAVMRVMYFGGQRFAKKLSTDPWYKVFRTEKVSAMIGGYVSVAPQAALSLSITKAVTEQKPKLRLNLRTELKIGFAKNVDNPRKTILAAVKQLADLSFGFLNTACVKFVSEKPFFGGSVDSSLDYCSEARKLATELADDSRWYYDAASPSTSIGNVLMTTPDNDPWWLTKDGLRSASLMLKWISKRYEKVGEELAKAQKWKFPPGTVKRWLMDQFTDVSIPISVDPTVLFNPDYLTIDMLAKGFVRPLIGFGIMNDHTGLGMMVRIDAQRATPIRASISTGALGVLKPHWFQPYMRPPVDISTFYFTAGVDVNLLGL